jgi:hypothetical protein
VPASQTNRTSAYSKRNSIFKSARRRVLQKKGEVQHGGLSVRLRTALTAEDIARQTGLTVEQVQDALNYLIQMGLLEMGPKSVGPL